MKLRSLKLVHRIVNFYKEVLNQSIIFKINNKKVSINIISINFINIEIRNIKIKIINNYLEGLALNESYRNHLFNQLFFNPNIHKKACLINYLKEKQKKRIKYISASFLKKTDYLIFSKFDLKIEKIKNRKTNFFFIDIILFLLIKRRDYNKSRKMYKEKYSKINHNIDYYKIIKDWNEGAQEIHVQKERKDFNNTIIYLKPDVNKLLRSTENMKYLKYLRNNDQDYFEYVPKIEFDLFLKQALKIYLLSLPAEIRFSLIQVVMERILIDDFINYIRKMFPKVKEFYTKEEYFIGTTYLTEKLKNNKIKTINYAHGIGSYCPIVNYDEFYVFSKAQAKYYLSSSKFKYYEFKVPKIKDKISIDKNFALFFICQNVISHVISLTINIFYKKTLEFIEQLAIDFNIPVYAKYHPDSKDSDKILSKNIIIIEDVRNLPKEFNYLALTFGSTLSMDLLDKMPFLIVNPGKIDYIKYKFPSEDFILINTYQELRNKIERFLTEKNYYYRYWDDLISLIIKNNV